MKKNLIISGLLCFSCTAGNMCAYAQISIAAQVRTRTELRDGQGAPLPKGAKPAFFTSQRSRLTAGFNSTRITLQLAAQDVRVWGQDVSTINRSTTADNNGLLLHEAWAEIALLDTAVQQGQLSLKLGRQEWVYDDSRLLGNLDWLQQGRRHDGAVLKWLNGAHAVHVGAAFNQNREAASGTVYQAAAPGNYPATTNGGTMYKSLQFVHASHKTKKGKYSLLFLADQFNKYNLQTTNNTTHKVYTPGAVGRFTTGVYTQNNWGKTTFTTAAYYQFGKNAQLQPTAAYLISGAINQNFSKSWNGGLGVDYTSGGNTANKNRAFDPLYGTPHKFWGLMDYFYVASPFGRSGLVDYYVKTNYKSGSKVALGADLHQFSSPSPIEVDGKESKARSFGQELDLTAHYALTGQIGIEAGFAHFFATDLLSSPAVKNISNARRHANWAYVMVNVKPEWLFK